MIWDKIKLWARRVWAHRTKNLGGLAIAAGAGESWLKAHDQLPLWIEHQRGVILMVFGGMVTFVGFYNTLASYMGWKDDP